VRILITLPWGQRLGGAEAMLQTVLDGAHQSGHELELVFFEDGPWPAELIDDGFRVEVIDAGRLRQVHRWITTVVSLARILRRRQPDLIINWAAKTQLYGSPAAMLTGMTDRVIWWQHGISARHWLDRCATALPAQAIGCSSNTAARAQEQMSGSRPTFVVLPGVPVPPAHRVPTLSEGPAPSWIQREPPVVGLVGRLQPGKGQDRLLRAQALLHERGHQIHTVLVGGDAYGLSSAYALSLPSLIEELGLASDVTMTGQVADAGPYIDQMDVLVSASDSESFGVVLLEAMARGVTVVAVDSGGPAEIIVDGVSGLLVQSDEPEALADALEPLLVSPDQHEDLSRAARERFLREFTAVAMRDRFFLQLERLLRDRSAL
jgi:glycosyltransferase involved in cell wall biosynthesis